MTTALKKTDTVNAIIDFSALTREQLDTIKATCAPNDITDEEFKLFLHVAATSGLDPLRRQIHCIRLQGRIVTIADVNGLQARAAKEDDFKGIKCAVVYEKDEFIVEDGEVTLHKSSPFKNGPLVGAWARVERDGMQPFTAVVSFREYFSDRNPLWKTKPSVMTLKCAKSTALRLAYPEQLGNTYDDAELGQVERELNPPPTAENKDEETKNALLKKAAEPRRPEPEDAQVIEAPPVPEGQRETKRETKPPAPEVPLPSGVKNCSKCGKPTVAPSGVCAVCKPTAPPIIDQKAGETEDQAERRFKDEASRVKKLTPWQKVVEFAANYGMDEKTLAGFCREKLELTKVGEKDVRRIQQALGDVFAGKAVNEPEDPIPPPGDDDAGPEALR